GRDRARMDRVGGHTRALESPGQLLGEQHVRQLRHRVLGQTGTAGGRLAHRLEVDATGVEVHRARHGDHAGGRALDELVPQQLGQQEVADVVDAERQLESACRAASPAADAGVVEQDVQRLALGEERLRALPYRLEIPQVELEVVRLTAGRLGDLLDDRASSFRGPAGQV